MRWRPAAPMASIRPKSSTATAVACPARHPGPASGDDGAGALHEYSRLDEEHSSNGGLGTRWARSRAGDYGASGATASVPQARGRAAQHQACKLERAQRPLQEADKWGARVDALRGVPGLPPVTGRRLLPLSTAWGVGGPCFDRLDRPPSHRPRCACSGLAQNNRTDLTNTVVRCQLGRAAWSPDLTSLVRHKASRLAGFHQALHLPHTMFTLSVLG